MNVVVGEAELPSVSVGNSEDPEVAFASSEERAVRFYMLRISQIELDGGQLASTDTVTLEIYRDRGRSAPRDLVARYTGTSQVTDLWKAVFLDQRLEYFDRARAGLVYARITNTTGNSRSSPFHLVITGEVED